MRFGGGWSHFLLLTLNSHFLVWQTALALEGDGDNIANRSTNNNAVMVNNRITINIGVTVYTYPLV